VRRWLDIGTWVLLLVVAAPPVISSARNLYTLGHRQLDLPGHWALLVPLSVDAAALLCVFLTLRAVHAGQSAGMARGLVIAFAGMSSWLGYQEAALIGTQAARVFYPVMPVAAAVLLDMVIRHRRRDALERLGALEPALPRFRALRWIVAPGETRRAWAAGVRHGVTDPAACLAFVREVDALRPLAPVDAVHYAFRAVGAVDHFAARAWLAARGVHVDQASLDAATSDRPRPPRHVPAVSASSAPMLATDPAPVPAPDTTTVPAPAPLPIPMQTASPVATPPSGVPVVVDVRDHDDAQDTDLSTMTKRDALRTAFAALGTWDVPSATQWLSARGVSVDRRDAHRVARQGQSERAQLTTVGAR
jgi:hypothetical protein